MTPVTTPATLSVNGQDVPMTMEQGYAVVTRPWKTGDVVWLHLPMPVRRVVASNDVSADRDRVALQRGPIVFAAEWPDNAGGHVLNLLLPDAEPLRAEFRPTLLNGVEVIAGHALAYSADAAGAVTPRKQPFVAIPVLRLGQPWAWGDVSVAGRSRGRRAPARLAECTRPRRLRPRSRTPRIDDRNSRAEALPHRTGLKPCPTEQG